jgi:hypothetical protein
MQQIRHYSQQFSLRRRSRRDILLAPFRAVAGGALAALPLAAKQWQTGMVDGVQGGRYSSVRVDKFGNAHVSSSSPTNQVLWYSFYDARLKRWFSTRVDQAPAWTSLALDSKQQPHIAYHEHGTGRLKYAHWDGTTWQKQPVMVPAERMAYATSIALDAQDRPRISFYEEFGLGLLKTRLRFVSWTGEYWELRTIDADEGSGKFQSLALNEAGLPRVAYANVRSETSGLRFASWDGRQWSVERLEGREAPIPMYSVAMALAPGDIPHIVYSDQRNRLIKHAVKRDGKWRMEVVDAVAAVGYPDQNGIDLDADGNIYLSYHDAGTGLLKVAYQDGGRWVSDVVDDGFSGFTNCLRVGGNSLWFTYGDMGGEQLRWARTELPGRTGAGRSGSTERSFTDKSRQEKNTRW